MEPLDLRGRTLPDLPLALARLHREVPVGSTAHVLLDADLDGDRLRQVVEAAGFARHARDPGGFVVLEARLALPDHVGPGMRLLCVGLNPSLHAAEAGVGYVTGSNRFWRAMLATGSASIDRDPLHLLVHHRIGMTDLVERPTARAAELTVSEYREGMARLTDLCRWLQPGAVAFVGLAGWRAAVDRRAVPGWQPAPVGPSPAYVLPSTSGLNAGTSLADLQDHLRRTLADPPS